MRFVFVFVLLNALLWGGGNSQLALDDPYHPFAYPPCDSPRLDPDTTLSISIPGCLQDGVAMLVPEHYRPVAKHFFHLQVLGAGMMMALYSMPESFTNWDKSKVESIPWYKRHYDNITSRPAWDQDSWIFNFVGHPLTGSSYYVWGRSSGLSWQESTMLAILSSTFFWEYGWEALIETPSIQDLFITPVIGSMVGEVFYRIRQNILTHGGTVLGSRWLGGVTTALLNPIGTFNTQLDHLADALAQRDVDVDVQLFYSPGIATSWLPQTSTASDPAGRYGSRYGVRFILRY